MKMNKTAAAITAGIITFGAMASASAAGIGFVNSGALLQAHPKMEKVQLDMRTAAQESTGKFQQPQRRQERSGKGTDRPGNPA